MLARCYDPDQRPTQANWSVVSSSRLVVLSNGTLDTDICGCESCSAAAIGQEIAPFCLLRLNKGINTHDQIDTVIASKGAASGLTTLDANGNVPLSQLGYMSAPTTKGSILVGNGMTVTAQAVGSNNVSLIADSTQANGVHWDNVDHTTLKNISTNTHAQIDTFITSKNMPNGLSFGQVPNEILTPIGSFPSMGPWIGHTDPNPDSTHTLRVY